jgi:formylmethanofuran dehydrogenase subunit E
MKSNKHFIKNGLLILLVFQVMGCTEYDLPTRDQTVYGSGFDLESCEQISEKDIYELCLRIYDKGPEEFEAILLTNKFHQHVGPNNVYGAKMALYAKKLLDGKNHEIYVISEAGTKTPISCLNDGIMVAIGATYGRNLIQSIPNSSKLAATFFYDNKSIRLQVKPEFLSYTKEYIKMSRIEHGGLTDGYFEDVRKMGLYVWENMSQEELFIVGEPDTEDICEFSEFNVNRFFNKLHNFMHRAEKVQDVIDFIDKDPCVRDGEVDNSKFPVTIRCIWKSNNKRIEFKHG